MPKRPLDDEVPEGETMPPENEDAAPSPDETDAGAEETSNVSPEEQQQYDQFVDKCYEVIYDEKVIGKVLKSLDATDDPKMNLANTIVMVVHFVAQSAMQAGQQISGDVLMQGGAEVLGDLADLAGRMSIHDYTQEEIDGAAYIAMDMYREKMKADGTLDLEAVKRDAAEIVTADREGRMDDLIPGAEAQFGVKKKDAEDDDPEEEPQDEESE